MKYRVEFECAGPDRSGVFQVHGTLADIYRELGSKYEPGLRLLTVEADGAYVGDVEFRTMLIQVAVLQLKHSIAAELNISFSDADELFDKVMEYGQSAAPDTTLTNEERDVTDLVERLEAFEERLGVYVVGLRAATSASDWANTVSVNGELHPADGTGLEKDIEVFADILDRNGRVIATESQSFEREEFFGFQTLSFQIYLQVPLGQIHKIRLYPKASRY